MFETLVVQPIINVVIVIYSIIPNFGLALIIFTILFRSAIHPLVKKQLAHNKRMHDIKPDLKQIKEDTKGDPQETSRRTSKLYKEKGVKPLAPLAPIALQVLVLIGLYTGLRDIADDANNIIDISYEFLRNFGSFKDVVQDVSNLDYTLLGAVDLSRSAGGSGIYVPALLLVMGSAISQYFMGAQTLPKEDKESKESDLQSKLGKGLMFLIPLIIFWVTYGLASVIALFWFASGAVGYVQQRYILKQQELKNES